VRFAVREQPDAVARGDGRRQPDGLQVMQVGDAGDLGLDVDWDIVEKLHEEVVQLTNSVAQLRPDRPT
jgi:hypothetical protein